MVTELRQLADRTRVMLAKGGTTESTQSSGPIDDDDLTAAVAGVLRLDRKAEPSLEPTPDNNDIERLAARAAVRQARAALEKIDGGMAPGNLADAEVSALELVIHTVGRPAMRYRNGRVDTPANAIGDNARWRFLVTAQRAKIDAISSRVGRIACGQGVPGPVLGTGWRVGQNLVITNRHVACQFVTASGAEPDTLQLQTSKAPFVDFAFTDQSAGPISLPIKECVYWSKELDLALLRLDVSQEAAPPEIPIDWDTNALGRELAPVGNDPPKFQGVEVYAIGHPYQFGAGTQIRQVFGDGMIDGRKRWAPGLVTGVEAAHPVMRHDCSTLGGNSGSCIVSTESQSHLAVGLHFGGKADERGAGFGSTNYAISFARIADHQAAQWLRTPT